MPELAVLFTDLVVFIVALMAMLVFFALWVPFAILGALLKPIPVVGGFINDTITSGLQAQMKVQARTLDNLAGPVRHFFWALVSPGAWLLSQLVDTIRDAKTTANTAHQHATVVQSNAEAFTTTQLNIIDEDLQRQIEENQAAANSLWTELLYYTNAQVGDVRNNADYLQTEINALQHIVPGITAAQLNALHDLVQSEINTALGTSEVYTRQQVGTVQGEITGLQGVVQGIPAEITGVIDQVVPGLIAGALTAAGVAALPGLLSQVQALTTEAETCLQPLCDTVTPNAKNLGNLGGLLKNLEALGVDAFFIALAVAAVESPATVAHDIEDVIGPLGSGVFTAYRDLVGI